MPNCYYYDEQRNHCNCYVNENLNELLAENAHLRERVDAAHTSRLLTENENEKLRELVRDMFGAYKGAVEMLPSSYSKNVVEMAVMDISDRMRELGVEVTS